MALTIQGVQNGIPVSSSDPNNAPFLSWTPYATETTYTQAQLTGVKSIQVSLVASGTVILTDQSGDAMPLPFSAGVYTLSFAPASVTFTNGAAGTIWMLR